MASAFELSPRLSTASVDCYGGESDAQLVIDLAACPGALCSSSVLPQMSRSSSSAVERIGSAGWGQISVGDLGLCTDHQMPQHLNEAVEWLDRAEQAREVAWPPPSRGSDSS